jgi:hypothetical protein
MPDPPPYVALPDGFRLYGELAFESDRVLIGDHDLRRMIEIRLGDCPVETPGGGLRRATKATVTVRLE